MRQKVLKVGSSIAVVMSKQYAAKLHVQAGDIVNTGIDEKLGTFFARRDPQMSTDVNKIAELTLNFINRYRKDLEELADK